MSAWPMGAPIPVATNLTSAFCKPPDSSTRVTYCSVVPSSAGIPILAPLSWVNCVIFESGSVYRADDGPTGADEHHALGTLLSGPLTPRSWRGERTQAGAIGIHSLRCSRL